MNSKRNILIYISLLFLALGFFRASNPFQSYYLSTSDLFFLILITLFSYQWYRIDAFINVYERNIGINIAILILPVIAFPYYFFDSRGFKLGLKYIVLFGCLFILWNTLVVVGRFISAVL